MRDGTRMSESMLWTFSCSQGASRGEEGKEKAIDNYPKETELAQKRLGVKSKMDAITLNARLSFPTPKQKYGLQN